MEDSFGSDFVTIVDDEGKEYELEVLSTLEYSGASYLAVIPADSGREDSLKLEVTILRSSEDADGPVLSIIEDPDELQAVEQLMMDQLYESPDTDEISG